MAKQEGTVPGRKLARMGAALVLGYAVILLVVWTQQRSLIYHPDRHSPPPAAQVLPGASDVTLHTSDGLELAAWWMPPAAGARDRGQAVLMAPGNGGNRAGRAPLAALLADQGFSVLLLEYRGYGGNPGSPSEAGLARDAEAAQAWLVDRGFGPLQTIYFGESLGTGVVSRLQVAHPPAGLVLRSPFTSLTDAARALVPLLPVGLILQDQFPIEELLATSSVPLTVIHGTRDSVVPTSQSATVARTAGNLFEEVVFPGADHNDSVMFGHEVVAAITRLADAVARR